MRLPVGSLKNWEQGQPLPRIDLAYRLAKSLKITVDQLIGEAFAEGLAHKGKRWKREEK